MSSTTFTDEAKKRIKQAIVEAETNTSGEIRVHIEAKCSGDVMDRAAFIFEKLNMHKTALRNGVLFYVATDAKKFAILGDGGINAKVEADFWDKTKDLVIEQFKKGDFTEGLVQGILQAGKSLKTHFPYQSDDKNELSDEISFG